MASLTQDITMDKGFARLSPEAAVLFTLLLARLNAWGKMDGDPSTVKGLCCRHVPYLTPETIPTLLCEISGKTSVKWWTDENGNSWVHATKWDKHNPGLRKDRRGKDALPSYSRSTPGQLPDNSGSTPGDESEQHLEESENIDYSGSTPERTKTKTKTETKTRTKTLHTEEVVTPPEDPPSESSTHKFLNLESRTKNRTGGLAPIGYVAPNIPLQAYLLKTFPFIQPHHIRDLLNRGITLQAAQEVGRIYQSEQKGIRDPPGFCYALLQDRLPGVESAHA